MDTGLTTKNGGKISVHCGRIVTTNLWNDKWYEITDLTAVTVIRNEAKKYSPDWNAVKAQFPNVDAIGHRYVRPASTTITTAPSPGVYVNNITTSAGTIPLCAADNNDGQTADNANVVCDDIATEAPVEPDPLPEEEVIFKCRLAAVDQLRNFYSEFKFSVAARMVNTMARQTCPDDVAAYANNYALLINHPDAPAIIEKVKSDEFKKLSEELIKYPPDKKINTRLDIYFGDAGTGKTTKAITEYPEAPVVPCNSAMLPDELLRTFDFNDENGNPVFKPSDLRKCMEEGKPIIFDEINLLSFDCLRLLQTLTDNKDSIDFNGDRIQIKPGFKIIGTMNLVVNDQVYSLPEPLVDRAGLIKQFTLSTEDLTGYAF